LRAEDKTPGSSDEVGGDLEVVAREGATQGQDVTTAVSSSWRGEGVVVAQGCMLLLFSEEEEGRNDSRPLRRRWTPCAGTESSTTE